MGVREGTLVLVQSRTQPETVHEEVKLEDEDVDEKGEA